MTDLDRLFERVSSLEQVVFALENRVHVLIASIWKEKKEKNEKTKRHISKNTAALKRKSKSNPKAVSRKNRHKLRNLLSVRRRGF